MDYKKITMQLQNFLKKECKKGDLVISYQASGIPGQMTPLFIHSGDGIDSIAITPFCVNNLSVYLSELNLDEVMDEKHKGKIFITVKPCDANSVFQMVSDAQIPREKVIIVIVECDGIIQTKDIRDAIQDDFASLEVEGEKVAVTTMQKGVVTLKKSDLIANKCKEGCYCQLPDTTDFYYIGNEKTIPKEKKSITATLVQDTLSRVDLKKLVDSEMSRCIRCNACRSICPACFCSDQCIMDKPKLIAPFIEKSSTLSNNTLYHLIRFFHVAPNCTGCGECERVCPQSIKLSIFYKYLHRFTEKEMGYLPGKTDLERQKLLNYRFGEDLV